LYLAEVINLASRRIVGWSMSERIQADLVCQALQTAYWRRKPAPGLFMYSDRGSQYASDRYLKLLADFRMLQSMSRRANCWDNAPMKSFFETLKIKRVYQLRYAIRAEARLDIVDWIEGFYNQMAALCREFDVSRKTGYNIFQSYKDCGLEGLTDRSRRPYRQANQLPLQIEKLILRLKRERPSWGAPKIREKLRRLHSDIPTPAISTVHAVRRSPRPYRGLSELQYPFHDRTITVTQCGRICFGRRKINLSTVFAGQNVGVKEVSDRIWLVSFMQYDFGFFDHETGRLTSGENPFAAKVLPSA
jgi:hypothetical protein